MISAFFPSSYRMTAFREGLKEAGYVEGQNVAIEHRTAEGRYELMPELVADLLRRQVTAIAIPVALSRPVLLELPRHQSRSSSES